MGNSAFSKAASGAITFAKGFDLPRATRALEAVAVLIAAIGTVIAAAEKVDEKWAHWRSVRDARSGKEPGEPSTGLDAA